MTMARGQGWPTQHGKPVGVVELDDQPETREGPNRALADDGEVRSTVEAG